MVVDDGNRLSSASGRDTGQSVQMTAGGSEMAATSCSSILCHVTLRSGKG